MQLTFSGKTALILGGTCELGLSLAEEMIKAQLTPLVSYRNQTGATRIADRLAAPYSGFFEAVYLDLSDPYQQQEERLSPFSDKIDYLVDLAQGDLESLIAAVDISEMENYFQTNISGRATVLKTISRAMLKKRRGRLVFVSSTAALKPNPGQGFYAAAKQAGEALYRNLGLELGGRGITTAIVQPGYIDSGRGKRFWNQQEHLALPAIPIKRPLATPEVCQFILFLLSDSAVALNGTSVCMDGGLTIGKP